MLHTVESPVRGLGWEVECAGGGGGVIQVRVQVGS